MALVCMQLKPRRHAALRLIFRDQELSMITHIRQCLLRLMQGYRGRAFVCWKQRTLEQQHFETKVHEKVEKIVQRIINSTQTILEIIQAWKATASRKSRVERKLQRKKLGLQYKMRRTFMGRWRDVVEEPGNVQRRIFWDRRCRSLVFRVDELDHVPRARMVVMRLMQGYKDRSFRIWKRRIPGKKQVETYMLSCRAFLM